MGLRAVADGGAGSGAGEQVHDHERMQRDVAAERRRVRLVVLVLAIVVIGLRALDADGGLERGVASAVTVWTGLAMLAGLLVVSLRARRRGALLDAWLWWIVAVMLWVFQLDAAVHVPAADAEGLLTSVQGVAALTGVGAYLAFPRRRARGHAVLVAVALLVSVTIATARFPLDATYSVATVLVLLVMVDGLAGSVQVLSVHEKRARTAAGLAVRDELTGLANRRGVGPALQALAPGDLVLLLDLDHFKLVNDTHGHAIGDGVLRAVGAALQACVRPGDVAARWGGEEFLVVVGGGDDLAPEVAAERLRRAVADAGTPVPVTASVGVAPVFVAEPWEVAVQRADEALYRAKHDGRDRVVVAPVARRG